MDIENIKPVDEDTTINKIKVKKGLALKSLTPKQKDMCIRNSVDATANALNLENTVGVQGSFNVAILFSNNPEKVLLDVNARTIPTINKYIETVIGENTSSYNRSMILFESEIQKDKVFIRWPAN